MLARISRTGGHSDAVQVQQHRVDRKQRGAILVRTHEDGQHRVHRKQQRDEPLRPALPFAALPSSDYALVSAYLQQQLTERSSAASAAHATAATRMPRARHAASCDARGHDAAHGEHVDGARQVQGHSLARRVAL